MTAAPNATQLIKEVLEMQERQRSEEVFVVVLFCLFLGLALFYFNFILGGMPQGYRGTGR